MDKTYIQQAETSVMLLPSGVVGGALLSQVDPMKYLLEPLTIPQHRPSLRRQRNGPPAQRENNNNRP